MYFNTSVPDAVSGAGIRIELGRLTDEIFHLAIDDHLWQPPIAWGRDFRSQLRGRLFWLRHPKKGARPKTGKRTMVGGLEVGNEAVDDRDLIYMELAGRHVYLRIEDVERMHDALDRTFEQPGG